MKNVNYLFVFLIILFISCEGIMEVAENLTDTTPPTVAITFPINNTILTGITTIKVNATDDSPIRKVIFMIDGSSIFTDYELPYEFDWDICTSELGEHTVIVEAEDEKNNKGQSVLFTFNVNASYDCLTVCGGTAVKDNCDVCYENGSQNSLWNSTCTDCANVAGGTSWMSDCGCVSADNSGDDCDDCAGTPNGTAVEDNCSECYVNGSQNSLWNSTCTDCAGVPGGDAELDFCEVCDGGNLARIDDCSGDGDCCPADWVADGLCDDEDQVYGCDLTCYDNDGGDCGSGRISSSLIKASNKPNRSDDCSDLGSGPNVDCVGECFGSANTDDCDVCYENGDQNSLWNSTCGDNEPPSSVTITSPEDGSTQMNSVVITSTAYDNEGIDYVELWVKSPSSSTFTNQGWEGTLIDNSEPYELIWDIMHVEFLNDYEIKVRAYDEAENYTDSSPITLQIYYPLAFYDIFTSSSTPVTLSSYSDDWDYDSEYFSIASIQDITFTDGTHNDMLYVKGIANGYQHLIYTVYPLNFTDYVDYYTFIDMYRIGTSGTSIRGIGLWDANTSQCHFLLSEWDGSNHNVQMTYYDYSESGFWASSPPVDWYLKDISNITGLSEFNLVYYNNTLTGFINNIEIGSYSLSGAAFINLVLFSQDNDEHLFDNVIVFGDNISSSARISSSISFIPPASALPNSSLTRDINSISSEPPLSSSSVPFKPENPLSILNSINR